MHAMCLHCVGVRAAVWMAHLEVGAVEQEWRSLGFAPLCQMLTQLCHHGWQALSQLARPDGALEALVSVAPLGSSSSSSRRRRV